ncbi:hypothetical protein EDB19DRAFT_1898348 [Suillus lakei]|nr:hypothetical protein EDB19DRAFT_1898348 [Suillus lakei]
MKWHGFGHRSDNPNAGDLALFCPACPQPGINISLSGDESLDDWKYTQSFVMDGNFKAEHLHPIKPFDEVWLSDGLGFIVGKDRYKKHLAETADAVEKSSCNNHRAVNQANAARHKLESTGIGGVACARHGCFVPHSMVDFQKGKRQMNMDYALCEAAQHNMEGITRAITFYDINCQYNKHLRVRVDRSRFLEMVPELTIIPGIGLWHVHGHQDSCYVRYASNFIEGIGRIDGEIMETLERIAQSSRINNPAAMDVYEINIKKDQCRCCMAEDLIPLEMSLREGQANDALHNLRIHLCNKAILFRTTVRQAKSQALKTRAWSQVTSVQQAVSLHASIYTKTRKQMMQLEPGQDQLQKYKPLLREQLKISGCLTYPTLS